MRFNFNKSPSIGILGLFLTLIAVLVGQSTAFPTPNSLKTETLDIIETSTQHLHNLGKRFTGQVSGKIGTAGPDKSDYPSDSEIEEACNPEAGKAFVFYSNADSSLAHRFAQENNGLIVRQTFPKHYVGKKPKGGKKRSDEWYQDFCDRFSGVFADKAKGTVYLVTDLDAGTRDCSVWERIEKPTLVANAAVTDIVAVSSADFNKRETIWSRTGKRDNAGLALRALKKQASGKKFCFNWEGCGEDPNDPDGDGGEECCD